MNDIQLNLNSSVWKGVVWDGKKIINRVNTNLVRLIIMQLVSETLLIETEKINLWIYILLPQIMRGIGPIYYQK